MSTTPDEMIEGRGTTVEEAAEDAARKTSKSVQHQTFQLTIYAELSGEHNPIHGYIVQLGGHP